MTQERMLLILQEQSDLKEDGKQKIGFVIQFLELVTSNYRHRIVDFSQLKKWKNILIVNKDIYAN